MEENPVTAMLRDLTGYMGGLEAIVEQIHSPEFLEVRAAMGPRHDQGLLFARQLAECGDFEAMRQPLIGYFELMLRKLKGGS